MRLTDLKSSRSGLAVAAVVAASLIAGWLAQPEGWTLGRSRMAGPEAMAMLRDEHALAAGYIAEATQSQREANLAATLEFERVKLAAREAETATQLAAGPDVRLPPAKARTTPRGAPREAAPVEPLQLAALMQPVAPPPAPPSGNVVVRHARVVAQTVERIPGWLRQAANWVVDLPGQALPRWERRFNVSSL